MKTALDRFVIGDPIKSLFRPVFSLPIDRHDERGLCVRLTVFAPDADGKLGKSDVTLERFFDTSDRCSDKMIFDFLRGMLREILMHELDESIAVDGFKIYDPHRGLP